MISGIMPCTNAVEMDVPFLLSLESWLPVCDEIIVITLSKDKSIDVLFEYAGRKKKVKVIIVDYPPEHNMLRQVAYSYCSSPDWVVHFDADYLISPEDGEILRSKILDAPDDVDCMTYNLVFLNYDASTTIYTESRKNDYYPNNGFTTFYPFIVSPKRGTFISIAKAQNQFGHYFDVEGAVSLVPGKWGQIWHPLHPEASQLTVLHTEQRVDHLMWSRSISVLYDKLSKPGLSSFSLEFVLNGSYLTSVDYPLLNKARAHYRKLKQTILQIEEEKAYQS